MNFSLNMDVVAWLMSQRDVLSGAAWVAALGGVIHGICVCNHMTWRTHKCYWLGTLAITISCAALVLALRYPTVDQLMAHEFLLLGIALCWLGDKRGIARGRSPAPISTKEFLQ